MLIFGNHTKFAVLRLFLHQKVDIFCNWSEYKTNWSEEFSGTFSLVHCEMLLMSCFNVSARLPVKTHKSAASLFKSRVQGVWEK